MATITLPKKLNTEVRVFIMHAIYEVLNDPDFGLELSNAAKQRLKKAKTSHEKTISFSEIKKKYL